MKTHNRIFALVLALVFLIPIVISGVAVVYQINQDRKTADLSKQLEEANKTATITPAISCTNDANQAYTKKEGKLEGTQLPNYTPVQDVPTLTCIDIKVGEGETVNAGATVTAHYTGAVAATGTIFQSSHDSGQPIPFSLNGVIKGWTDGVPGMKVGGIRRLLIPADQAYGANPPQGSNIPANAALVFDIELTAVQQ